MAYATYKLLYNDACVAVFVLGLETEGEVHFYVIEPGSPAAPEWYDEYDADLVFTELETFLTSVASGAFDDAALDNPDFAFEIGPVVQAEDCTTAAMMAMDTGYHLKLFSAASVEYRMNASTEPFPVALIISDPLGSQTLCSALVGANPFAPHNFNRGHRRMIARKMEALNKELRRVAGTQISFSPSRFLGPQFRTESLPTIEAETIHEAREKAAAYLENWYAARAM